MQQWVACDCTLQGTFWFNENLVLNFNGVVGSREMLCHRFSLASFAPSACCLCNFFWLTGYELLVCSKAGHRSTPSPLIRIYGGGKSKMCQSSGGVRDPDRGSAARTEKWGHREGVEFKKKKRLFFFLVIGKIYLLNFSQCAWLAGLSRWQSAVFNMKITLIPGAVERIIKGDCRNFAPEPTAIFLLFLNNYSPVYCSFVLGKKNWSGNLQFSKRS